MKLYYHSWRTDTASNNIYTNCKHTSDEEAEGGVLHAPQTHHELIIRGEGHQVPIFICNTIIIISHTLVNYKGCR